MSPVLYCFDFKVCSRFRLCRRPWSVYGLHVGDGHLAPPNTLVLAVTLSSFRNANSSTSPLARRAAANANTLPLKTSCSIMYSSIPECWEFRLNRPSDLRALVIHHSDSHLDELDLLSLECLLCVNHLLFSVVASLLGFSQEFRRNSVCIHESRPRHATTYYGRHRR